MADFQRRQDLYFLHGALTEITNALQKAVALKQHIEHEELKGEAPDPEEAPADKATGLYIPEYTQDED